MVVGSANVALQELGKKLGLKTQKHPNPYRVSGANNPNTPISLTNQCLVTFLICNDFEDLCCVSVIFHLEDHGSTVGG